MGAAFYKLFISIIFGALYICYCVLCIICFRGICDTEDSDDDVIERCPKQRRIEMNEKQHFFTSDRK